MSLEDQAIALSPNLYGLGNFPSFTHCQSVDLLMPVRPSTPAILISVIPPSFWFWSVLALFISNVLANLSLLVVLV